LPVHLRYKRVREEKCGNVSCFPFPSDCRIQFSNALFSLLCQPLNRHTVGENKHTALNLELKRDIASRMLKCPSTLEGRPLLRFAVRRLASGGWLDRIVFCALWPAGKLRNILLALQDHFAAIKYIRDQIRPAPPPHPQVLDWSKLIAKASETKSHDAGNIKKALTFDAPVVWEPCDTAFRSNMNASPGWKDLELLLRTLARVHARALILSMPISGNFYDHMPASRGRLAKIITRSFVRSCNDITFC